MFEINVGDRLWFFYSGELTEVVIKNVGRSYARFDRSKHRLNLASKKIECKMPGGWWDSCHYFTSREDANYWMEERLSQIAR